MTPELTALTLAALLQVVQLCLYSVAAQRQVGRKTALKPRDEPVELTGTSGRLHRAMNNHFEGLMLFGIACLVITVTAQSTGFTGFCAVTYLIARVLYIPAYVFGWVPWRSVIWLVGLLATTSMLLAALI
ncbi:MAPEG family protein [Roseovarius aestuarii]|uniref:MAPEG family protein n=1 Tax=Roseovarius aestuarii TaxID=475083 RepID=A0A1X7BP91_9RHOB|nr:MAPEG family protein [Roseovarius aestuarii]SMC11334.1 MAPEG family protein [Roseovarius aestuarii]